MILSIPGQADPSSRVPGWEVPGDWGAPEISKCKVIFHAAKVHKQTLSYPYIISCVYIYIYMILYMYVNCMDIYTYNTIHTHYRCLSFFWMLSAKYRGIKIHMCSGWQPPDFSVFFLGEVVDLDLPPSERWRHLVTPMASQIRRWEWLIYGPTVLIIFYSTKSTF